MPPDVTITADILEQRPGPALSASSDMPDISPDPPPAPEPEVPAGAPPPAEPTPEPEEPAAESEPVEPEKRAGITERFATITEQRRAAEARADRLEAMLRDALALVPKQAEPPPPP